MKRLILVLLILTTVVVLPATVVLASDISGAIYRATITVSNNSTSTVTNIATVFTANTSAWQDADYINGSCNNTAIVSAAGADVPYMPGISDNPWVVWVPSIGGNTYQNDSLYMGGASSMNSTLYYFPGYTGMTTVDNATLELGDNFTIEDKGFIDTTQVGANLTYKEGAFRRYISAIGEVTATIHSANMSPSSFTDPDNNWTDEANAYDGSTATWAYNAANEHYLQVTPASAITSSRVWVYAARWTGSEANDNIDVDVYYSAAWHNVFSGAIVKNTWTECAIGSQESVSDVRVKKNDPDGGICYLKEVYIEQDSVSVTATGVTSAEHTIITAADGTSLTISVDGTVLDTVALNGANVTDNNNAWYFVDGYCMPYMEYAEITVDGVQAGYWDWDYATTFDDQSANSNTATPTFRTTTGNASVNASIVYFTPIATAIAPPFAVDDAPEFNTSNITTTGNFTSGSVPGGGPPGSDVIDAAATAAGVPNVWLWGLLAIFGLATAGLVISWMERQYGSGGGSLTLRMIVAITVLGILIAWAKFDWWMMLFYLVITIAVLMMSRQGEVGGNVSQHGLIGFLSMSWIGLTVVNRILEGQFLTSNERVWSNYYAFTQEFKVFEIFSMPVLNLQFFTHGIPALIKWDYSFFGGSAQMFQYLLYSLTAVASFVIFGIVIGLLYNAFRVR